MAYSKFRDVKKVAITFGLSVRRGTLFPEKLAVQKPSSWLVETLAIMRDNGFETEKERSERLVSPVLIEIRKQNDSQITIYSGHELNVDASKSLNGECDYLLSLGFKVIDFVDTPVFSVVEAKKQDMEYGTAQCAAQIVGAMLYNENDGKPVPFLYGAATDGLKWRFIKLEKNVLTIDLDYYYLKDIEELLAVLQFIVDDCKNAVKN